MSIDFSSALRLVIIVGVLAFAGLGFAVFTLERAKPSSTAATPVPVHHVATHDPTHAPAAKPAAAVKPVVKLVPGLPGPIRYALLRHRSVVVAIHGRGGFDAVAAEEARAGASLAHTSFLSLDVRKPRYATPIAAFADSISDPAVIVVRRPGIVVKRLEGFHDRQVVAQAAHDAR